MKPTGHIDYVELPTTDVDATKRFYSNAFGWRFVDYGPDYIAVEGAGLDAGFYRSDLAAHTSTGAALVILYSSNLEATETAVRQAGGTITRPTFAFPGGRRFHFADPSGNELAVWTDLEGIG